MAEPIKSEATKAAILKTAINLSSSIGLEGLTIGSLATATGMSKSGLFRHFKSKEMLQVETLEATSTRFVSHVLKPAFKSPRGIPRLKSLTQNWMNWFLEELPGGCPVVGASTEFDDKPGPVRDKTKEVIQNIFMVIHQSAIKCKYEKHFRRTINPQVFAFQFWGILLATHNHARLLDKEDTKRLCLMSINDLIENAKRRDYAFEPFTIPDFGKEKP